MASLEIAPTVLRSPQRGRWRGEPANEFTGPLAKVAALLPTFGRVPFGASPRLDMIFRRRAGRGDMAVPTGVVSKSYVLVQHASVIDALVKSLRSLDVEPSGLRCRLTMSESGARIAMRLELPDTFTYKAPDGHPMALTFECFNSVDRTVPLFALLGWFRFVCSNGLTVGTEHARVRRQHRPALRIGDFQPILADGLSAAKDDCVALERLMARRVSAGALCTWVDGPVALEWGGFAAARTYAIATTGFDGEPSRSPREARPHERPVSRATVVPGAQAPCSNSYGLTQALAWIAARRADVAERLAWRNQITELVAQVH